MRWSIPARLTLGKASVRGGLRVLLPQGGQADCALSVSPPLYLFSDEPPLVPVSEKLAQVVMQYEQAFSALLTVFWKSIPSDNTVPTGEARGKIGGGVAQGAWPQGKWYRASHGLTLSVNYYLPDAHFLMAVPLLQGRPPRSLTLSGSS